MSEPNKWKIRLLTSLHHAAVADADRCDYYAGQPRYAWLWAYAGCVQPVLRHVAGTARGTSQGLSRTLIFGEIR